MKLFVVLVLIGVCAAGRVHNHVNFCRNNAVGEALAGAARKLIVDELPDIIGHCESAAIALENGDFFGRDCIRAFDQSFCYGYTLYEKYEVAKLAADCTYGDSDSDYSVSVTYQDMANVLSPGGPVSKLGNLACAHALPCFKHVVKQIADCARADESFYTKAAEKARARLEPLIVENLGSVKNSLICHFGEKSDAMTLFSLIQDRITSYDDLVTLMNTHISGDTQDSLVAGAKSGMYDFFDGSNDFCDAGCVHKTTKYFKKLFIATHDAETCPTIEFYCGDCQANAESFIMGSAGSVPCCTMNALDSITSTIQSVIENYGELLIDIEAAVTETVEESGVSTDGYEAVKAAAMEQAACLGDTYDELDSEACVEA